MGFLALDELAPRLRAEGWRLVWENAVAGGVAAGRPLLLAKPQTFMNQSGRAVQALLASAGVRPEEALVIHDDLDLGFGRLRVRQGGGHGGHNGVRSIVEALGTGDFVRIKLGIGRPERKEDLVDYVLSPFAPEEAEEAEDLVRRAALAAEAVLLEGVERAGSRFNR
jgi:peptidyl-tRNA hydrolase, PTH1 family